MLTPSECRTQIRVYRCMRMLRLAAALSVLLALPPSPPAAANQRIVPPGNSAVNQYTEVLPTPGGNAVEGQGGGGAPAAVLGGTDARRLEALGPEGRAAAEVAARTAPGSAHAAGGKGGNGGGATAAVGGGSAAVIGQATGFSSASPSTPLLALILIATLVGSALYLARKRRGGSR